MLSGKPPRPWKKSRRRGISVVRIALLVVLLGAAAAYAIWRVRPQSLPSIPIGAERIATPEFDISGPESRWVLHVLQSSPLHDIDGRWFGDACAPDARFGASEAYLLTQREHSSPYPVDTLRVLVVLRNDGDATVDIERGTSERKQRQSGILPDGAEDFRDLLIENGYPTMSTSDMTTSTGASFVALQSCIRGRFYGVARPLPASEEGEPLRRLAQAIVQRVSAEPSP